LSGKAFIVLDEASQVELERICTDADGPAALVFLRRKIAPQLHKAGPGLASELTRPGI